MYMKHTKFGLGKVIYEVDEMYLVYFFRSNYALHRGILHGKPLCKNYHGYWFSKSIVKFCSVEDPKILGALIERRQQWKPTTE